MAKRPAPPLPKSLKPLPKRPGEEGLKPSPVEAVVDGGIHAVDWIDERTSLAGGVRWRLFRKVPKGMNWVYTLGSATMCAFLNQAVTGLVLALCYRAGCAGGPRR